MDAARNRSGYDSPFSTFAASTNVTPTMASAASARRRYLAHLFSMEYWWAIGGFLGVLTILRLVHLISVWSILRSPREERSDDSEEGVRMIVSRSHPLVGRVWRCVGAAIAILLFRLPVPFGKVHRFSNAAEVFCVCGYIGATLAWTLMDTPDIDNPKVSTSNLILNLRALT